MGITDTQSFTLVIRDLFFDTLTKKEPFFASYHARKTRMVSIQPEQLPFLGVYLVDENMTPDGDANAGEVRFVHNARIGFSVMIANNDQDAAEQQIDAAYWRIMNRLWTDQYIMNLLDTTNPTDGSQNPDNTRIESIQRGVRRHVFGNTAQSNQTPIAEMQYEVTVLYRTYWPPNVTDDLNEIVVTTHVKDNALEIIRKYDFTQTRRKSNGG